MKLFRTLCLLFVSLAMPHAAMAAPAYPGKILRAMADGSLAEVYLRGDEHVHYYEDASGLLLQEDAQGRLLPAENQLAMRQEIARQTAMQQARRLKPDSIVRRFPTTGVVKGLVILVNYQDIKFSIDNAHDVFNAMANNHGYTGPHASGSVYDYFVAQSGGRFTPEFEVVGPVELPHNRRYYGENEKAAEMIEDACVQAKALGVDFTQFDANNDGTVDFVFVIYAGYGESQGGPTESIWPKMLDMTYETWTTFDGLYLGVAACTCELHGNQGAVIDGVGTFCHEFSHILGLPDVYDTSTTGTADGMMAWDVMDHGLYNDDTRTPAGYTAMDRYTVGWLTPHVLETPALDLSLPALATSNEAYFLVSPTNPNEYYTLENRQQVGWDSALPGHGLIVTHVHYVPSLWSSNRVNRIGSGYYEHIELVPADGRKSADSYPGDPYPGSRNVMACNLSSWHTYDTAVSNPITNIHEEGGSIVFDYRADEASGIAAPQANPQHGAASYDLLGRRATSGRGIRIQQSAKVITR